ncbi:MAG: DUF1549 domain-containing protein [Pirellulaceae bacterium]
MRRTQVASGENSGYTEKQRFGFVEIDSRKKLASRRLQHPPYMLEARFRNWLARSIVVLAIGGTVVSEAFSGEPTTIVLAAPTAEVSVAPVVAKINESVAARWNAYKIQPAKPCSDREFVRRVYLDVAGRVPAVSEVDSFLSDPHDERRTMLVDELLGSEDYVQNFADIFDTLLMGRTDERHYEQRVEHGWRAYLEDVFRQNRPWNEVAQEILLARPDSEQASGAVWFLYERKDKHQAIAEAIAPAFFGIRIECAQCHDHMIAHEIRQEHYWGLVAFFNRSKNVDTKNGPRIAESAVGGFSEFADLSGSSSPNRLRFFGADEVMEDRPQQDSTANSGADDDALYTAAEHDGDPRVPLFSRRERFVKDVLAGHPLVARAMVNRLWAVVFGRGIVHPYDKIDSAHAPSHPELLDWLSNYFTETNYDIRQLLREMLLADAYQLSSIQPAGCDDPALFAWYLERPLTAEQLARSAQLAVRGHVDGELALQTAFRQQVGEVLPESYSVGIDDALFLSNGEALERFLIESTDEQSLIGRLQATQPNPARAESLFQTVLSRSPTAEEVAAIDSYLSERSDRIDDALRQCVWAVLNSAEFQFNH